MAFRKASIGVIGGAEASQESLDLACEVGRLIAKNGAVLVCGGLGGIMEAASRGAHEAGGMVVGILPGDDAAAANVHVDVAIPTGMGIGRNTLVVRASDALIAFPGSYGTLSEIALALSLDKTVVYLPGAWDLRKVGPVPVAQFKQAMNASQAIGLALDAAR